MNAKEQIIRLLKREIAYFKASDLDTTALYNLIATTEAAIFDVPSDKEIDKLIKNYIIDLVDCKSVKNSEQSWAYAICFQVIKEFLNYKKPEHDGK